jgi:hypothetical protein
LPIDLRALASRVALAGAVVAVLDGAFAVVLYVPILHLTTPPRLFQSIAGALLGKATFQGGAATVLLGLAIHCTVALSWSAAYAALWSAFRFLRELTASPWGVAVAGVVFGMLVWLAMDLIVLPLTRARPTPVTSPLFVVMLLWHAIGVGPPMAALIRAGASLESPAATNPT